MTGRWWRKQLALAGLMAGLSVGAAEAHPHIFIDASVDVVFDDAGRVAALRQNWTFDAAFSAWVVQGLDANGDRIVSPAELQPLADDNLQGLAEFGFYTFAGQDSGIMEWVPAGDQSMVYEDGQVTLRYTIDAAAPQAVGERFELGIYDPEYYVAIAFAGAGDVHLEGAPAGCGAQLQPPVEMAPDVQERLYALGPDVTELPPDLAAAMRGTQGLIVITCGGDGQATPPAATALDAVTQLAASPPATPFGGPPPEVGLPLPRTGVLGWVNAQQREFYRALNDALAALRSDWTAFWVLGGLSFLYGVFHAAGPGHGKVVIGSYVLATESQARRGIALSFVAALLQALVAIAFVGLAAGVLGWSSTAMDVAANWVGIVSYALVALLGLWLVARKVFGWGHHHHHAPDLTQKAHAHLHGHDHHHHHEHAHHHDHDEHAHVVTPKAAGGSWREQLGVVLAVGLRPCSGALVVLVFALSQGLLAAGVGAVLLMGMGTGITVAGLAGLAVSAKSLAQRVGGADNAVTRSLVSWAELFGAVAVLGFGVVLLLASV